LGEHYSQRLKRLSRSTIVIERPVSSFSNTIQTVQKLTIDLVWGALLVA
jgi:hypothetical protein